MKCLAVRTLASAVAKNSARATAATAATNVAKKHLCKFNKLLDLDSIGGKTEPRLNWATDCGLLWAWLRVAH